MAEETKPIRVPYKTVNGVAIPTDIYTPIFQQRFNHGSAPVLIMLHGGGGIVGSSSLNSKDQIDDCLQRGWIVLSIEYRLCPGVDILEGPITDARDVLVWAQSGGLAGALEEASNPLRPDARRIMAMGVSAGGHLALSLAWGTERPPLAILDFYGPKHFDDPFWSQSIESLQRTLPPPPPASFFEHLFQEKETFIGGVSLEGQSNDEQVSPTQKPKSPNSRLLLTMQALANGKVLETIWPRTPNDFHLIDPMLNVTKLWPPTVFVHGTADVWIPIYLSKHLEAKLRGEGIETEFIEVEGASHTFVGEMVKGSPTWDTQRRGFEFLQKVLDRSYN